MADAIRVGDRVVVTDDEPLLDLSAGTWATVTSVGTPRDRKEVGFASDDGREWVADPSTLERQGEEQS